MPRDRVPPQAPAPSRAHLNQSNAPLGPVLHSSPCLPIPTSFPVCALEKAALESAVSWCRLQSADRDGVGVGAGGGRWEAKRSPRIASPADSNRRDSRQRPTGRRRRRRGGRG